MLIEDQELRELYAVASTEHLDNLDAGVLLLKQSGTIPDDMKDLLREAHSLKGDSRMLGVEDGESLTRIVETLLKQLAAGQSEPTPEFCDRLSIGLGALRQVVSEAVNGTPVEADLAAVMAQLAEVEIVEATVEPAPSTEATALADAEGVEAGIVDHDLADAAMLPDADSPVAESLINDPWDAAAASEAVEQAVEQADVAEPSDTALVTEGLDSPGAEEQTPEQAALASEFMKLAGMMGAGDVAPEADPEAVDAVDQSGIDSPVGEEQTPEQAALSDEFMKLAGAMGASDSVTEADDDLDLADAADLPEADAQIVEAAASGADVAVDEVAESVEEAALAIAMDDQSMAEQLIDEQSIDESVDEQSDQQSTEEAAPAIAIDEQSTDKGSVDQQSAVAVDVAVASHQTAASEGIEIPAVEQPTPEQAALADAFLKLAGEMAANDSVTETDEQGAQASLMAMASMEMGSATASEMASATVEPSEQSVAASPAVDAWDAVEAMVEAEASPAMEISQDFTAVAATTAEDNVEGNAGTYAGFIDDEELRGLYEAASGEHLATLEMGCLHLEKNPEDFSQFKELLRAAHSLKGDSRMLGVTDAESLTHKLETLLQAIQGGQRSVTPALCDRLYAGIDSLKQIAHGAVHGPAPQLSLEQMMSRLMGAEGAEAEAALEATGLAVAEATLTAKQPTDVRPVKAPVEAKVDPLKQPAQSAQLAQKNSKPKKSSPASSGEKAASPAETIRVNSAKLDSLVTQVSELAVTKRRIVEWSDQVTSMLDLWESWTQDAYVQRKTVSRIQEELEPETAELFTNLQQKHLKKVETLGTLVQSFRSQTSEGGARLDAISNDLEAGILNLRMLPLSNVLNLFPRMVRDLSRQQKKDVELSLEGGETLVDKRILEEIKDPLSHLLRNALDHGIEQPEERLQVGKPAQASLQVRGFQRGSSIVIEISDDGRGLNLEKIKKTALKRGIVDEAALAQMSIPDIHALIFESGFSTKTMVTEISGRGVGMDVVKTNIERLKGSIFIDSTPGQGCTFRLTLNPSLATTDALILRVNQVSYALPIECVERMVTIAREDIFTLKGNLAATIAGEAVSVAWLSDLLNLPTRVPDSATEAERLSEKIPCIVVQLGSQKLGFFVDELLDQQEILLKRQSQLLKRVRNIAGSTILGDGEVCLVLNPQDLFVTTLKQSGAIEKFEQLSASLERETRILLVEDSLPIRTQMRRILEGAGYIVTATVDGLDGYNTLRAGESSFDAIISDVEMPNLTGLELAARVREHSEYDDLPFILITTLATDEDKKRGADAGANAYITKGDFDQSLLLNTLKGLVQS